MASDSIHQSRQTDIYDPLPEGPYVRVLILEPGRRRQPVCCRLEIVNLEQRPDFEAISYVWGRGIKRKKVKCNGTRVKITANLFQALVAVRHPSRQRTVWADSISINQRDGKEKGLQVALMGLVYNRARRVLIHLAGDDGGHAHGIATFVAEKVAFIRQCLSKGLRSIPDISEAEIQALMGDRRFQSVKYMLDHQWFQRGWVIQEAVLAQDAVIIWGSCRVTRLESLLICQNWLLRGLRGLWMGSNVNPLDLLPELYRYRFREVAQALGFVLDAQPSLLQILHMARYDLRLTDPRDRVYAFLYLDRLEEQLDTATDAMRRLTIEPDYTKSVSEVYTGFARHINMSRDIRWLHDVRNTQQTFMDKQFASWVPRWDIAGPVSLANKPGYPTMHPSHHPQGSGSQQGVRFDGNYLIVPGVVFDRVQACSTSPSAGPRNLRSMTLNDVASFWLMVKASPFGSAYPPEHLGLALLHTLIRWWLYSVSSEDFLETEVFWQFLRATEEDLEAPQSLIIRMPHIAQCIESATWGRKLVFTDRGYFGLAPQIAKENDVCCIIFGCCHPFILRTVDQPSVSETQNYRIVGDAWVPGKQVLQDSVGRLGMPDFGLKGGMEWETWGLEERDINLA